MTRLPFDPADLRRQAEKTLRNRDLPSKANLDPIRLLHELQVHQIELELQNEELIATNRELDALRAKYQSLYEAAPVGYLTLSAAGHVLDCNLKALQMLGLDYARVLKRPLRDRIDPASLPAFDALLAEAAGAAELALQRPRLIPMYVRAQLRTLQLPHHDGPLFLFVMMDVSALKFAIDDIASVIDKRDGAA
jgi:PAS domain-containing protein